MSVCQFYLFMTCCPETLCVVSNTRHLGLYQKYNKQNCQQEAKLALRSVTAVRPLPGLFLVADLGGGSLELILGQDSQMLRCSSFQLGAVRWQKAVDAGNADTLDSIHQEIDRLRAFTANHQAQICIGLGGAFRTMHPRCA